MPASRRARVSLLLALLAALTAAAAGARAEEETGPRVTMPANVDLEAVLGMLQPALPGVVVADAAAAPAVLRRPLRDASVPQVLDRLCLDFDRFRVRRGRTLALQLRYSDPEEPPAPELEELRRTLDDLAALLRGVPMLSMQVYTRSQNAFADSLTPEQQARMQQGGLTLAELPEAQRHAFLALNNTTLYGPTLMEALRAQAVLREWSRAVARPLGPPERPRQQLYVAPPPTLGNPDPEGTMLHLMPATRNPRPPRAEGVELPPPPRLPADLRVPWPLPLQRLDLAAFARKLRESGGPVLEVPEYARQRTFWIYAQRGTRGEALQALADLWGWEWRAVKGGYRLDRPRAERPRDLLDLHRRLQRAVPPALVHQLRGAIEERALARWAADADAITRNAAAVAGAEWKEIRVAQLSPETRHRLAEFIVRTSLHLWFQSGHGAKPEPPAWFLAPERGVLKLSGPLGPGRHPLLSLEVPVGPGRVEMWGWQVNTSVISPGPARPR